LAESPGKARKKEQEKELSKKDLSKVENGRTGSGQPLASERGGSYEDGGRRIRCMQKIPS
jgi:phage portal protein BeeE